MKNIYWLCIFVFGCFVMCTRPSSAEILMMPVEVVTDSAGTGDGGNPWGGHQTRIVRTKDGVFTAYLVQGKGYKEKEWRLAWRIDNTWHVAAEGAAGREPVNLLALPDGTLNIIGFPEGKCTVWSGKPHDGKVDMLSMRVQGINESFWPYNAAGIDSKGNIAIVASAGSKPGYFQWIYYSAKHKKWTPHSDETDFRYCYSYVFPKKKNELFLVSNRDVTWDTLGYKKPGNKTFNYVFNQLRFWRTDNVNEKSLKNLAFIGEEPTEKFPDVYCCMSHNDCYLDTHNRMHILYRRSGETTLGKSQFRHAMFTSDGELLKDSELPQGIGTYSDIFQDAKKRFYILSSSGFLYPAGKDGFELGEPVKLDFDGHNVEYSGFGLSVPRTGTPLSNIIDVVYPSRGGKEWIYFRLHL